MSDTSLVNTPSNGDSTRSGATWTGTRDYPHIAAEKYRAALERVSRVHARFQKELDSIGEGIGKQTALSAAVIDRFRQVGPHLDSIAENIKAMSESTRRIGVCVNEGRAGLKASIGEVQTTIERLRSRNQAMQDILDISRRVTESVNKIAEIAIENKVIAINASVTASKASDKVKGFKVIASEITRLSATMAERVGLIVDRAAQVGARVRQVIGNMDESIKSTQTALGNIDEAFGLLDHIDATIRQADAANSNMLEENDLLSQKARTLDEALGMIGANAGDAGRRADEIQEAMRQQAALIRRIEQFLPELQSGADAIAARGVAARGVVARGDGATEGPKRLRCSESALTDYDPALTRMLREMHYINFVCIRLLRYSSDKKLVPYLAETWFLHADGRTWEFRLKENVLFHDGSAVGARDVKFSLERLMNPALASPYANLFSVIEGAEDFIAGRADAVSGIVILDDHTIRIRLKSSFNFFLSLLALSYSSILKENKAIFSRPLGRADLISAGPFRFAASGDPGTDLLACNGNFVNGRPFLDSLEIRRGLDDVSGAIGRGELDLAYNIPAASADLFKSRGFDGELRYYTSRYCYGLVVNYRRQNFITRHAELRRALVMALDKDEIVRGPLEGKAVRADAVLPPETLDIGGRQFIAYDPDGARRIIDRYKTRENLDEPINIAFRGYATIPRLEEVADRIVRSLERLGLRINASFHPAATPIASFKDGYDLVFLGFLSELDLYSALEPFINPQGGDNYFNYNNPEIFAMLDDSIGIKDNGVRKERFIDILEKLTLDVFMMPLFFNKSFVAIPRHVHSILLSAEESFMPEVVFLSAGREAGSDGAGRAGAQATGQYAEAVRKLEAETAVVVDAAGGLIETGRNIGRLIARQKDSISKANALFSSFAESADNVQTTRAGVVGKIREATEEAGKSGQATGLIQAGLAGLSAALESSVRTLDQAKKDIHDMLSIVKDISESNEFIGSIAVNAAVISAKTDVRSGDLVKVSQAISEQARSNTANAEDIRHILEEMGKIVGGHADFLTGLVNALGKAGSSVSQNGNILEKVRPLLEAANSGSAVMEGTSRKLATLIREAHGSVDLISEAVDRLALDAGTLQFGLDMEQAVTGTLKDVAAINNDVSGFLRARP